MNAFFSFNRIPTLGGVSRASAANRLWARAGGTRAPGTGTRPGGRRARRPCWAKTPTHPQLPLAPTYPLPALSATPAREAGARLRRRTKTPRTAAQRSRGTSSCPHRGPPSVAPMPRPRDSMTCVINKSSRAGGKFSGAKLESADSTFVERGAAIKAAPRPHLRLWWSGEMKFRNRVFLAGMILPFAGGGTPRDFLTLSISVRTLDRSQPVQGPEPWCPVERPRGNRKLWLPPSLPPALLCLHHPSAKSSRSDISKPGFATLQGKSTYLQGFVKCLQ